MRLGLGVEDREPRALPEQDLVALAEPLPPRDRDRQPLDRARAIRGHVGRGVIGRRAARHRRQELAIEHRVVDPARVPDPADVVAVQHEVERRRVIEVRVREHDVIDRAARGRRGRAGLDAQVVAGRAEGRRQVGEHAQRLLVPVVGPRVVEHREVGALDQDGEPRADVDHVDVVAAR